MSEKKQTPYQYDEEQASINADSSLPGAQECAMAHALLMIAEQLRVANLIAIGAESAKPYRTLLDNSADSYSYDFAPDIAAILGLGDDHE